MALVAGTWSTMLAFGAAAGGLATQLVGIDGAFAIDSATFMLAFVILWGLPSLPPREDGKKVDRAPFGDIVPYLRTRPLLTTTLTMKAGMALGSGAIVVLPVFGNGLFSATAGPIWIGLMYSARGVGSLIGSLGLRRVFGDTQPAMRLALGLSLAIMGLSYVALGFAPNIWLAALAALGGGIGVGGIWVNSSTLSQLTTDQYIRGRLFSAEFALMTLTVTVMSLVAGGVGDLGLLDARGIAVASGLLLAIPLSVWVTTALARGDDEV
jgi:hypothetical protein